MSRYSAPALLAASAVALAGCGRPAEETDVRRAVTAFFTQIGDHQYRRACAELVPQAAESLRTGDSGCAEALGSLKLTGGAIRAVRVWGDRAQAVLSRDTVFLSRFPHGWKVAAAGCRPKPEGPYDCDVAA